MKNKILIVIDMQKDFVTNKDILGSDAAISILPNVREKILSYVKASNPIIFTHDTHGANYMSTLEGKHLPVPHCIFDSDGWNIEPSLTAVAGNSPIYINKRNFGFTHWNYYIKSKTLNGSDLDIEMVGVCTDICVISNALILRALFPEANIKVDAACCAGTSVDAHNAALTVMKSCQINIS